MIRLALRVRRADAESALVALLDFAPGGLEEIDIDAEVVEYALYGPSADLPGDAELRSALGDQLVGAERAEVADDWAERWREFHQPLQLGDRLMVRPPWIPSRGTEIDLVIDPGQAFGTGAHPTTALCLELLLERAASGPAAGESGRGVVDLGCGSGVLAILAAKLGCSDVVALDHDPLAVEATRANARINDVTLADIRRFDLCDEDVPAAHVVMANLLAPLLETWSRRMEAATLPRPDTIVASGLLAEESERVGMAFARVGYSESERRVRGDWAALVLDRRG